MTIAEKTLITVEATVNASVQKTWNTWTSPEYITKWNNPSPDWHTPKAEHDLKTGGKFNFRMEARDGSIGFDFGGVYDIVKPNEQIDSTLGDGRKVKVTFIPQGNQTKIVQTFEAETINSIEQQRTGWQGILNSFKKYTEAINHN